MAVAVADVDAGSNVVVLGHGRSSPSCGSALDLRSSTCAIVGSVRSIISAFSSHLNRCTVYTGVSETPVLWLEPFLTEVFRVGFMTRIIVHRGLLAQRLCALL